MGRYLDTPEKLATVEKWLSSLDSVWCDGKGNGGRGLPDADMVAWCIRLNAIPGVCTLQSCAGHIDPEGYQSSGHLWLRLDSALSAAFDDLACDLAAKPGMERVYRMYTGEGQEVTVIVFAGNERNLLAESMATILSFVQRLRSGSFQLSP